MNPELVKKYKSQLSKSKRVYMVFKRIFDIILSLIAIVLLSLPMLVVAIIIKCTSKGPVFFKQERFGQYEKVFKIIKFRSMKVGSKEIAPSDMTEEEQKKMTYKWGSFMRKTSIDELPQLFNILAGQMSFIGPRPGAAHNEEDLQHRREERVPSPFAVKPGLSGYAQIHMKRDHDPRKKSFFDSYYVDHMSLWFDLKIFLYSALVAVGFAKGR